MNKYHAFIQQLDHEDEVAFVSDVPMENNKHGEICIGQRRVIKRLGSFEHIQDAYQCACKYLMSCRADNRTFIDTAEKVAFWPGVIMAFRVQGLVLAGTYELIHIFKKETIEASRCGGAPDVFLEYQHGIDATLDDVEEAIEYFKDRGINS